MGKKSLEIQEELYKTKYESRCSLLHCPKISPFIMPPDKLMEAVVVQSILRLG
jgi:hypothetical protein